MALVDEQSCQCSISPLEWFDVLPTQTAIEKSDWTEYTPVSPISDKSAVEFYIPPSTSEYIDLKNTYLYVQFRIVKGDGTALEETDKVAPINDIFNGLWKNIELFLNDRLIYQSNNNHGYISMIKNLLMDTEEYVTSQKSMQLFFKDTPGQMDVTDPTLPNSSNLIPGWDSDIRGDLIDIDATVGNKGLHKRSTYTKASRVTDVLGPLSLDLFEQLKYLPNGIGIKLRLDRQKHKYVLMAAAGANYQLQLLSASLYVRKVFPNPGVMLGHGDALMKNNAKYPITRTVCKSMSLSKGHSTFKEDKVFLGQLPKRVIIGMVDEESSTGSYIKNPYNFKLYNLSSISLSANGSPIAGSPLKVTNKCYGQCYKTLFSGLNKLDTDRGSIIKREDWERGYALVAFDLTPDFDYEDHYSLVKYGNLKLELEFEEKVPCGVEILVFAQFDNMIEINHNREIIFDYS